MTEPVKGVRLLDGSIWRDHEGIVAQSGSPEAKYDTPLITMTPDGRNPMGCDPRTIPPDVLLAEGEYEATPARAIRAKCLQCAGSWHEVAECHLVHCALWPFRMGSSPFRPKREISEDERAAMRERAKRLHGAVGGNATVRAAATDTAAGISGPSE